MKKYGNIQAALEQEIQNSDTQSLEMPINNMAEITSKIFRENIQKTVHEIAKEQGLSTKFADKISNQSAQIISRKIENVQRHTEIKHKEAEVEYKRIIAQIKGEQSGSPKIAQEKFEKAKVAYETKQQEIMKAFKEQIQETVESESIKLIENTTRTILEE